MPMAKVSKIVQRMQNRGFVYWTHDASDRPGTFITLSEIGRDALKNQEEKIAVFFENAIIKYGAEDFIKLMELRKRFNKMFFLIPGYGAQGGKAEDVAMYLNNGNGGVVNSSRGILLAYKKHNNEKEFDKCARAEAIKMRDEIREAVRNLK